MKILMMILMVVLSGCKSKDEPTVAPAPLPTPHHCSDNTEYTTDNGGGKLTYTISENTCNTLTSVVFNADGLMIAATKVIDTVFGEDELVTVTYSVNGFYYRDRTVGRYQDTGTQAIDYEYINGDNFITTTQVPSYLVKYIYEGEPEYDRILNDALSAIVLLEAEEAISEL